MPPRQTRVEKLLKDAEEAGKVADRQRDEREASRESMEEIKEATGKDLDSVLERLDSIARQDS